MTQVLHRPDQINCRKSHGQIFGCQNESCSCSARTLNYFPLSSLHPSPPSNPTSLVPKKNLLLHFPIKKSPYLYFDYPPAVIWGKKGWKVCPLQGYLVRTPNVMDLTLHPTRGSVGLGRTERAKLRHNTEFFFFCFFFFLWMGEGVSLLFCLRKHFLDGNIQLNFVQTECTFSVSVGFCARILNTSKEHVYPFISY